MATAKELREYSATVLVRKWLNLRNELRATSEEDVEDKLPHFLGSTLEMFLPDYPAEPLIRDYFQHAAAWQKQVQPLIQNPHTIPEDEREALISAFKITQQRTALIVSRGWNFPAITWSDATKDALANLGKGAAAAGGAIGVVVLLVLLFYFSRK